MSRRRAGGIGQGETWSVGTASWAAWEVMLGQLSCVTRPGWIWDAFGCAEGGEVSWNCAVWTILAGSEISELVAEALQLKENCVDGHSTGEALNPCIFQLVQLFSP